MKMGRNQMPKTAKELVKTRPGVWDRRMAIILALCTNALTSPLNSDDNADYILAVANKIIEETEQ